MEASPPNPIGGVAPAHLAADADRRPKVVILGAGYAGASCAKEIQKRLGSQVDLVIVDKRKSTVHKIGAIRACVLGQSYSDRVLIPSDNLAEPGLGRIIYESITEVTPAFVKLESGQDLPFDFLVCATGSVNFSIAEPPIRYSDRDSMKKFYDKVSKKIRSAEKILIVGGGPVGVELAGEISYEYHSKVINIVHTGHRLCTGLSPPPGKAFYKKLHTAVDEAKIKLFLNQKLQNVNWREHGNKPYISSAETEYITDKNHKINADLVLLCAGKRIQSSFYPAAWKNEMTQELKVRRTLQLLDHQNIFAIGDLNDLPENKQASLAAKQGIDCAANIANLIAGKAKLKSHKLHFGWGRTWVMVPVGRKKGAGYLGFYSIGNSWTTSKKGKELKTKETWKMFNILDVPKEVGGPSLGNKLGTVKKVPKLTPGEKAYNVRTRSIEVRNSGTRESMESTTSLANMYESTTGHDSHGTMESGTNVGGVAGKPNRGDVISFAGSLDGRGDSVNFGKKGKSGTKPVATFAEVNDEDEW